MLKPHNRSAQNQRRSLSTSNSTGDCNGNDINRNENAVLSSCRRGYGHHQRNIGTDISHPIRTPPQSNIRSESKSESDSDSDDEEDISEWSDVKMLRRGYLKKSPYKILMDYNDKYGDQSKDVFSGEQRLLNKMCRWCLTAVYTPQHFCLFKPSMQFCGCLSCSGFVVQIVTGVCVAWFV